MLVAIFCLLLVSLALAAVLVYVLYVRDELAIFYRRLHVTELEGECASHGKRIGELEDALSELEDMIAGTIGVRRASP